MAFELGTFGWLVGPLLKHGVSFAIEKLKATFNSKNVKKKVKKAAWSMYVEMVTRVITQPLPPKHGDEKAALKSVFSLFETTRKILNKYGPDCSEFSEVAFAVLNQKVRPFTAKWHRKKLKGAFKSKAKCAKFHEDLAALQKVLSAWTVVLAEMAGVEDTTNLSVE